MASIPYPNIDPVMFSLGPVSIRWYGMAYVAGFIVAGLILRSLVRRWEVGLTDDDMLDIVLACVIGLVAGARLGYVVFYGAGGYWDDPVSILRFWDGGMSFHGGLAGIMLAGWLMARRKGVPVLRLFDLGAVGAPLGIFFGRIANFINGELWGRVSDVPWAMVFPHAPGTLPRHPSQLYEALLEGLVLFCVLWLMSRRKRADGLLIGTLLALYAVFRTFIEFFREPDVQLGFILGPFTMGQLLTLPMLVAGGWLIWRALKVERAPKAGSSDPTDPA
ncbi:MAG: prolipoprotein diacylglyceryl transferase [Actinobacteria bacterium]|nr:prolipoprotein diacylglyceryl transferase [Actinomycetota bacterium]